MMPDAPDYNGTVIYSGRHSALGAQQDPVCVPICDGYARGEKSLRYWRQPSPLPHPGDQHSGIDSPDERGLRLAARVSEVEDQGEVAVVDGDAGDVDDAGDALLPTVSMWVMEEGKGGRLEGEPWIPLRAGTWWMWG